MTSILLKEKYKVFTRIVKTEHVFIHIQKYAFCNRHIPHIANIAASRDIRTIRNVSTAGLRFLCSFPCYDAIAIIKTPRNFIPIDLKLGI